MRTKKYSDEFKATAVLMSHLDDCSVKSVAESLDIHPVMLSNWRRMYDEGKIKVDKRKKKVKKSKKLSDNEQINTLLAEIDRLKMENDILKKWQRFLAEQRRKNINS
jgi:transposase